MLALVLAAVNVGIGVMNQSARATLAQQQAFAAQTAQLMRVGQLVATRLAEAARRTDDAPLRALLSSNGIALEPGAAPATAAAPEPPTPPRAP